MNTIQEVPVFALAPYVLLATLVLALMAGGVAWAATGNRAFMWAMLLGSLLSYVATYIFMALIFWLIL